MQGALLSSSRAAALSFALADALHAPNGAAAGAHDALQWSCQRSPAAISSHAFLARHVPKPLVPVRVLLCLCTTVSCFASVNSDSLTYHGHAIPTLAFLV